MRIQVLQIRSGGTISCSQIAVIGSAPHAYLGDPRRAPVIPAASGLTKIAENVSKIAENVSQIQRRKGVDKILK